MPSVTWTDKSGWHDRPFRTSHQASAWFKRLPLETEGFVSGALTVNGRAVDRWYTDGLVLKRESVSGPQPRLGG